MQRTGSDFIESECPKNNKHCIDWGWYFLGGVRKLGNVFELKLESFLFHSLIT